MEEESVVDVGIDRVEHFGEEGDCFGGSLWDRGSACCGCCTLIGAWKEIVI